MSLRPAPTRRRRVSPTIETLEGRALMTTGIPISPAPLPPGFYTLGNRRSPVVPTGATPEMASFIDPTTNVDHVRNVGVGHGSFLAPFVNLVTGRHRVLVGNGSNLQDNVTVDARRGDVTIGDNDALAHGVTIVGPSTIGGSADLPTFASFNAVIDRATLEPGTYVSAMARVGQGVVIHTGTKVLAGAYVRTQAEADDPALGKVTPMTQADRDFVDGVLYVNHNLASGYAGLYYTNPRLLLGIGANPDTEFNPDPTTPTANGQTRPLAGFRARIIGKVTLADSIYLLDKVLGLGDSIRADEGYPFQIGKIRRFANRVTFHALEGTGITTGRNLVLGYHDVVHGGPDIPDADPSETTVIGDNVRVGDYSVVFRSKLGNNVTIGRKVLLDRCNLADGTVVPDGTIMVQNVVVGSVQW